MSFFANLVTALAVALAVTAAVIDVRERRIPNRLTYPLMLVGLALHTFANGWSGFVQALAGGLCFGGVFLAFFAVRAMGAGDVKLAAALGCVVTLKASLEVLAATALAGGALALFRIFTTGTALQTARNVFSVVGFHARRGLRVHPEVNLDNPKAARMPYGLAFAAGTVYWAFSSLWR